MSSKTLTFAAVATAALTLCGCQANSWSNGTAGDARYPGSRPLIENDSTRDSLGDNTDIPFPNDGTAVTQILHGSETVEGQFICKESVSLFEGGSIELSANGLVGGLVGGLLDQLSADSVSSLLNSLEDSMLALDNDLNSAAAVTQTLTGLGGVLNSVDVTTYLPAGVNNPKGAYAVAAVSLPASLLELGLASTIRVVTLLEDEVQEDGAEISVTTLSLLGFSTSQLADRAFAFVGYKASKPFDAIRLELSAQLLALDLGSSVYIHELCTHGTLVTPSNGA